MSDFPKYVSVKRAQILFGLGKTKIYELIEAQEVDSKKVGRSRLISVASFDAFMARKS